MDLLTRILTGDKEAMGKADSVGDLAGEIGFKIGRATLTTAASSALLALAHTGTTYSSWFDLGVGLSAGACAVADFKAVKRHLDEIKTQFGSLKRK